MLFFIFLGWENTDSGRKGVVINVCGDVGRIPWVNWRLPIFKRNWWETDETIPADFRTLAGVASFSILLSTNILTRVLWASHGGFIRFQKLGIAYDYKKLSSRENQTRVYTGQKWAVEMLSRLRFFSFVARSPYFIFCLPSTSFGVWLKMIFWHKYRFFSKRLIFKLFSVWNRKRLFILLIFQICTKNKTCAAETQNLKKNENKNVKSPEMKKVVCKYWETL